MISEIKNENLIIYYSLNRYRDYLKKAMADGDDALEYTDLLDLYKETEEIINKYQRLIVEENRY